MHKRCDILVIGGGPAGLMAAIIASRAGAQVLVLDRMPRVGKKLLATGAGRCNLCNMKPTIDHYHGADTTFMLPALERFSAGKTMNFFYDLGIETRVAPGGRVFPITGQAANVLDVLRYECERLGVEEICETKINRIESYRKGGFVCKFGDGEEGFIAEKVILATGGQSMPNLGSNGGGYKLATSLGHRVTELWPSRVQIKLDLPFLKRLKGVKIVGAVQILVDGEIKRRDEGDILFADYGVSGPPILQLSRTVGQYENTERTITLEIDCLPDCDVEQVAAQLERRFALNAGKTLEEGMIGLINKRAIPYLLRGAGFKNLERNCGSLTTDERGALARTLKAWSLPVSGTLSWMYSQVTAGGVDLSEVSAETLESKLVPGIFFAGELLDIDGDCGGFNLQWAWSSGYLAGLSAAQSLGKTLDETTSTAKQETL